MRKRVNAAKGGYTPAEALENYHVSEVDAHEKMGAKALMEGDHTKYIKHAAKKHSHLDGRVNASIAKDAAARELFSAKRARSSVVIALLRKTIALGRMRGSGRNKRNITRVLQAPKKRFLAGPRKK